MTFDPVEMGKRLRELRKQYGKTQEELAEEINISPEYMRKIENGTRLCPLPILADIACYFDVATDYLIFGWRDDKSQTRQKILSLLDELFDLVSKL